MQIQTVGILSLGDMGQAITAVLNQNGLKLLPPLMIAVPELSN
jgi:3-hydroxyacyl-CoA dehydrogenase